MISRVALLLSTVLFVTALGATWRFIREARELQLALRAAREEVYTLRNTLAGLREAARHNQPEAKPAPSRADVAARVQPVGGFAMEELEAQAQKSSEERKEALLASPTLQVLFEESRRGEYRARFAALFQRLQLSAEQQSALIAALVEWNMKVNDLEAVMKQHGLLRNDPALKTQRAEADAALIRGVQAVLGPDGTTITREYSRLDDARAHVAGYGGLFSRLGQQLTFSQLEALTNAFGEASPRVSPQPTRLTTAQWDQIAARAQTILTPEQWQIFQSTTSPGQNAGRWESAANEALDNVSRAGGTR